MLVMNCELPALSAGASHFITTTLPRITVRAGTRSRGRRSMGTRDHPIPDDDKGLFMMRHAER